MTQLIAALCSEGAVLVADSMTLQLRPDGAIQIIIEPKIRYHGFTLGYGGTKVAFAATALVDPAAPVRPRDGLDFDNTVRQLFADFAAAEAEAALAIHPDLDDGEWLGPPNTSPTLLAVGQDRGRSPRLAYLSPTAEEIHNDPVIRASGGWSHRPEARIPELLAEPVPATLEGCVSLLTGWARRYLEQLYAGKTLAEWAAAGTAHHAAFPLTVFTLTATAAHSMEITA